MNSNHTSIKNWAEDERPREKMLHKGAASLSDAELLAILINSGTRERSAIDLAREILAQAHNHLHELGKLSLKELQQTKGIGAARAITIAAALEIGKRRQTGEALQRPIIHHSKDAAAILIPLLCDLTYEAFYVLHLNQGCGVIKHEMISTGGLTGTVADIRVILKNALLNNASHLIIAHNHPSGNLQPSASDKKITLQIKDAAAIMDIKLLDHIIIGGTSYFSFGDAGLI